MSSPVQELAPRSVALQHLDPDDLDGQLPSSLNELSLLGRKASAKAGAIFNATLRSERERKKRHERIEKLHQRDQRREAKFLRRIDRIVGLLVVHKCPKCCGQSLRIWLDEHSEMHACRYAACRYLQVWALKPPLERAEPRPVIFHPDTGEQLVPVPLPSRLVSKAFLLRLVHEYGYPEAAAVSSFTLCFTYRRPEKRKPQPLPEPTRENLMKALSRRRYKDPNMRLAVRSVIGGAAVDKVASRYRLDRGDLLRRVRQLRQTLEPA